MPTSRPAKLTLDRVQELRNKCDIYDTPGISNNLSFWSDLVEVLDAWIEIYQSSYGCDNPHCIQPTCRTRRMLQRNSS